MIAGILNVKRRCQPVSFERNRSCSRGVKPDWNEQKAQTFWIIARQSQGQRTALKHLYRIYSDKRDTPELYKVAKRILEVEPGDLIALNNVASLGLLLDQDADRVTKLAEDLYSKASSVPAFETTYAFALLKTQRSGEALR